MTTSGGGAGGSDRVTEVSPRAGHLATAAEVLNAGGPAGGGFGLRAGAVAKAAGIARSSLYRLWPSLGELADDVRLYTVTRHPDWRRTLLEHAPGEPIGAVLAHATQVDPGFVAPGGRALAAVSPPSAFRQRAAAIEANWFVVFGAWLAAHLHAVDRRPRPGIAPADLAVVITAVTEGSIIQASLSAGRDRAFWRDDDAAALGWVVERLVDRLTVAGRGAAEAPPAPVVEQDDPSAWSGRQELVLGAILRATVDLPFDHPDAPLAVRLVDLGALSRRLGITERRLHQIWATPSDFNGELFAFQAQRLRIATEQVATEVLMTKLAGAAELDEAVLPASLGAVIAAGSGGDAVGLFSVAFAVADPRLSAVVEAEFVRWRAEQQVMFLALLHVFDLHLDEAVGIERFTWAVFATLMGSMRLAILQPSLLDHQIGYLGASSPVLTVAAHAVWMSQVEVCTHGRGRHHG